MIRRPRNWASEAQLTHNVLRSHDLSNFPSNQPTTYPTPSPTRVKATAQRAKSQHRNIQPYGPRVKEPAPKKPTLKELTPAGPGASSAT
ncbi:hypothetical protein CLAFUW4_10701 [Fulvia fulva]|uniref:Uncharacterized protein n=1 Tax=Passalora fulva TaxID=5499 RepID=A0A9Q8LEV2_PASFU|nr:uncharacterized protein CLAFUR5_05315 [Fulvia fulva]KAK4615875.1 hypothetical protein CLAFUR4_10706 [Fulvia fulva]KAK4616613.1 hypothetical protein CLAFUR0_10712 [Fulvia fulva]UJO15939.1 hypothetical protein CLAFUR5_05315 [Fulvia fulva]WPV19706.1 hypothetical protein CLAFUW4_10701 [Fulvia fulva]WPV33776.1 hypothetical protein CLAFUW7_10703 [Fulvia fulva]